MGEGLSPLEEWAGSALVTGEQFFLAAYGMGSQILKNIVSPDKNANRSAARDREVDIQP